jgi:1-acyl-sn-glycerol-3-phosphate acyltransferase
MLKTILFRVSLSLWFAAWAPLLLIGLISKKLNHKFVMADARGVLWLARIITGIRYEIIDMVPGRNGKIDPKTIVASKHMSILEIAILATNYKNMFFIIKRELLWIPIYGWAFWRMGFIGVNRSKGTTNMKILAERAADKINKGETLVIFPEGTRTKPGYGVHLRRGLLFIAAAAKIPIQPVGTDAGLFWPKRGRMRGGTARVWLESVLPFDSTLDEIAESIARHSA